MVLLKVLDFTIPHPAWFGAHACAYTSDSASATPIFSCSKRSARPPSFLSLVVELKLHCQAWERIGSHISPTFSNSCLYLLWRLRLRCTGKKTSVGRLYTFKQVPQYRSLGQVFYASALQKQAYCSSARRCGIYWV